MTERTWGYYGHEIGEWYGSMSIPLEHRRPLGKATRYVLDRVTRPLAQLHRPRKLELSWTEYDETGAEIEYHELEETTLREWGDVSRKLVHVESIARGTLAIDHLFIDLDTVVVEPNGETWADESAKFQISITDERKPEEASISYYTYIDPWLSMTYFGKDYERRSNRSVAALNRPRLEAFLRDLAVLCVDGRLERGSSKLYDFAMTEAGFRDVDDLPWGPR